MVLPAAPAPGRQPPEETRTRILSCAVPLFARAGYEGVSMREVATAVGVTPAALYYHFPDKEQLYLAAVGYIFNDRVPLALAALAGDGDAWTRLEAFVLRLTQQVAGNPDFLRIMQWVLLDADGARAQALSATVFRPFFVTVAALLADIDSHHDVHRLTISVLGLVMFPFQSDSVARFMPGYLSTYDQPDAQAKHIVALLRGGVPGGAP